MVTVTICCAGVIALLMSDLPFYTDPVKYPNTYLSSPLLPVLLSLLIGYVVASVFFNVRHVTAFICMLACHWKSSPARKLQSDAQVACIQTVAWHVPTLAVWSKGPMPVLNDSHLRAGV